MSTKTSKQILQNLDVNLKINTPETVLIHAGINDILNDNTNQTLKIF